MVYTDIYLDLQDPGSTKFIKVSQLDSGQRRFRFHMLDGATEWEIPDGCSASLIGTKPDKNGFMYECSYVGSTAYKTCEEQMTAVEGLVKCKLAFTAPDTTRISSFLFYLIVEKDAVDDNTVFSTSDLAYAQTLIRELENAGSFITSLSRKLQFYKYGDETLYLTNG